MPKIYSRYDVPAHSGFKSDKPSLTQQHFKDDADINNIIARYNQTGFLVDPLNPATRQPQFGDFSVSSDYHESQTIIAHAQQSFDQLPAYLRKRFNNSPFELLQFLEKEENRDEAIRLGIVSKPSVVANPVTGGDSVPAGSSITAVPAGPTAP